MKQFEHVVIVELVVFRTGVRVDKLMRYDVWLALTPTKDIGMTLDL